MNKEKQESIKNLQSLKNVGVATAKRLYSIGIKNPKQLKKSNAKKVYEKLKKKEGGELDNVFYIKCEERFQMKHGGIVKIREETQKPRHKKFYK